jgi:hypothetical protein
MDQKASEGVGLETRFNAVRAFFIDRKVTNYISVFAAFGLNVDRKKVTNWWNGRMRIRPRDERTLAQLEQVVERLKQVN